MDMKTINEIKELIRLNRVDEFYNDKYWRHLSGSIIKEANNECELCKRRGRYARAELVHHVKPLRQFPMLAYSRYYTDKNGVQHKQLIALCRSCHEEQHPERHRASRSFTNEERW